MLPRRPDAGLSLCPPCLETLVRLVPPWCERCGLPLAWPGATCPDCVRSRPRFDGCRAAFAYAGEARSLLLAFKHGRAFELAAPFGRLMAAAAVSGQVADADLVVPVPTTVVRFLHRGYNQAALLARVVASTLGRPLEGRALRRVQDRGSQGRRSHAERAERVRGCFAVARPAAVAGRRVLLVDDVVTTGATASECAGALKDAGATWVAVLAFARAVPGL